MDEPISVGQTGDVYTREQAVGAGGRAAWTLLIRDACVGAASIAAKVLR